MEPIPFLKPTLVQLESYKKYLEVIDSNQIYSNFGPLNNEFENKVLFNYFNQNGALTTVNNATSGLLLAISQMKLKTGKYALMPSFTFSATALAAMWCGLEPYFIDIDKSTWLMDEEKLNKVITELGDEVAIVVPYATFGTAINFEYYNNLLDKGIPVVVDAAPCFGTNVNGHQFGIGFKGTVIFSFHATKPFGIGEGGLVYSGDKELIQNIRVASNFAYFGKRESIDLGFNAKLSEFYAAIGLATLEGYPSKIQKRQKVYNDYIHEFNRLGLFQKGWEVQQTQGDIPFQFFTVLCPESETNINYINKLRESEINAVSYFAPACHQQLQFKLCPTSDLTVTNNVTTRVLSLPFWEDMSIDVVKRVVEGLV